MSQAGEAGAGGDGPSGGGSGEPRRTDGRLLERLERYVKVESPSGDVDRARTLAEMIGADLSESGAVVELVPAPGWGSHVRAEVAGAADLEPVLVLGHLDTVFPVGTLAERPFRVVDGRVEGPGVFDMKSGVAVLVEALLRLTEAGTRPRRPVRVLITCDEEVGSPTSRGLIEELGRGCRATLVLEPSLPGGAVKTARKGVAVYTLRIHGRASHAGVDPERGVSAIAELADQIQAVLALADHAAGTTLNVGTVRGGTASNVVPAEALAEVDVRFASMAEGERVDAALRGLRAVRPGARLELGGGINRPPLERTQGVVALYELARGLAEEIGFELLEGSTGGGSDGCFTAALGVPTLDGLGVAGNGAHAVDEHIVLADLERRAELVRRLLVTL